MTVQQEECAHCGQLCGSYAAGYAGIALPGQPLRRLCHPNDPARPDCYRRVTVYHEPIGTLRYVPRLPAGIEGAGGHGLAGLYGDGDALPLPAGSG